MGSMHKPALGIQPGQTVGRKDKVGYRPPALRPCKESNVFPLRAILLPLIIQALDSQTARGDSSCMRRSNVQWEIRSGITNIRGWDAASTKGAETIGGTMGMKVIFKSG